jgi:3-phenylpropionate/trans-cinnamate dioxygenase ferredoxin reductase subunit
MSDRERQVVVVGGGPAARSAVAAYRDAGGRGPVTILAAEPELPYERPPLTKEFLRGELPRAELLLAPAGWYREHEVEVVTAAEVAELDPERGRAIAADGREWSFDRCLLATGARPLVPDLPGTDLPGVQTIRMIPDSERLAKLAGSRVLVVGSGFIGCEAAASLAMRGAEVAIASLEPSPQVERLGEEVSAILAGWLRAHGIELLGGAELEAIEGGDGPAGLRARFADGREQRAEAVLLALGVARNDALAAAAGIETDAGVPVDASMVSSDPRLLAAGDVALAENPSAGRRLKVEHWGEALNQGEVAGRTLAGEEASWSAAPGFWSTIGERRLKYAGWGDGWDEVRVDWREDGAFAAWYGRDGELVGVLAHERDEDYESGRERIEERAPWS